MQKERENLSQHSFFTVGIVCLSAFLVQIVLGLTVVLFNHESLPQFILNEQLYLIVMIIPEAILFAYIAGRIEEEIGKAWGTILAILGYAVLLYLAIILDFSQGVILTFAFFIGFFIAAVILCIIGLRKRKGGLLLSSYMCYNLFYVCYISIISLFGDHVQLEVSLLFLLPLLLLIVTDLVIYARSKSRNTIKAS